MIYSTLPGQNIFAQDCSARLLSVAIQHEMDHLDGLLFLDRIASLKTGLFRRKKYV